MLSLEVLHSNLSEAEMPSGPTGKTEMWADVHWGRNWTCTSFTLEVCIDHRAGQAKLGKAFKEGVVVALFVVPLLVGVHKDSPEQQIFF